MKKLFRKAFADSLPVLMGYTTMGFAAGVLLAAKGGVMIPPLWAAATAVTMVSGTMQFMIVEPLAKCAPLLSVALLTLFINFRYALYGFSMLERWRSVPLLRKLFLIHGLTDETYALEVACKLENPREHLFYCTALSALNISYWLVGVTAGALAGCALPIPTKGIEFAMVALFLVIFTDQCREFVTRRRS